MNERYVFATDVHGNLNNYEKLFKAAKEHGADNIIIGGDIAPKKLVFQGAGQHYPAIRHPRFDGRDYTPLPPDDYFRAGYAIETLTTEQVELMKSLPGFDILKIVMANTSTTDPSIVRELPRLDSQAFDEMRRNTTYSFMKLIAGEPDLKRYLSKVFYDAKNASLKPEIAWDRLFDYVLYNYVKKLSASTHAKHESIFQEIYDGKKKSFLEFVIGTLGIDDGVLSVLVSRLFAKALEKTGVMISSKEGIAKTMPQQKQFLKILLEEIGKLRQTFTGRIFTILGNDDSPELDGLLNEGDREGLITNVTNRVVTLDDETQMIGYSYVPPIEGVTFDPWFRGEKDIYADLMALHNNQIGPNKRVIGNIHTPPSGTLVSMVKFPPAEAMDWGSNGVRKYIEEKHPHLILSGHLHEPWRITGAVRDMVGSTTVVNPGASEYHPRIMTGNLKVLGMEKIL